MDGLPMFQRVLDNSLIIQYFRVFIPFLIPIYSSFNQHTDDANKTLINFQNHVWNMAHISKRWILVDTMLDVLNRTKKDAIDNNSVSFRGIKALWGDFNIRMYVCSKFKSVALKFYTNILPIHWKARFYTTAIHALETPILVKVCQNKTRHRRCEYCLRCTAWIRCDAVTCGFWLQRQTKW